MWRQIPSNPQGLRPKAAESQPQFSLQRNQSGWISLLILLSVYLGIFVLIALGESTGFSLLKLAVLPLIAALQNHLQILFHEGAHFNLHPKRKWNDLLTNLFCGLPFFSLVRHYRYFHLAHHRHLLDPDKDPEVSFYAEQGYHFIGKRPLSLLKSFFADLFGFHSAQFIFSYNRYLINETRAGRMVPPSRREWRLIFLSGSFILLVSILKFGILKGIAFYWLLPQFTFLFFFLKLQGYGEHLRRTTSVLGCTLSHEFGLFPRFFLYPLNSELHLEHHLFPTVPWYRLRSLREALRKQGENEGEGIGFRSYFFGPDSFIKTVLSHNPPIHR